ncbi:MAG TPA: sugar kinase [Gemmatimonadaceae bacterium]|nr:sugar kinase [Gemmatimonadaceae bacterium]
MELVTFGEAMLRLMPPGQQPLARANKFDVHVGGSELNVAVAAAKLGVASRWLSRLPDNPIGHIIADRAQEQGVDASWISWTPEGRAGVYYVEFNAESGATNVTYDRSGSAMARISRGMIDWNRALRDAKWFHVSGITPALSESAAQTLVEAIQAAERIGLTISYDLNFRPKLWRPERARAAQETLFRYVDLLIASDRGARLVFSAPDYSPEDLARGIQDRYGIPSVAITVRNARRPGHTSWSALVVADGETHCAPAFDAEVIEPLGAGDAFAAGLIYGRLRGEAWDVAARHGADLAAKKHGTPGEFSLATSVA